jgi:hypothetical protein
MLSNNPSFGVDKRLTSVMYFAAAVICWRASDLAMLTAELAVWRLIAILFSFIGISSPLNVWSKITETGRRLARLGGWYHRRQIVQLRFMKGVSFVCAAAALSAIIWARGASTACWLAVVAAMLLLCFVLIRAASLHQFDRFINRTALGLRWNGIFEGGAVLIVISAALWSCLHAAALDG